MLERKVLKKIKIMDQMTIFKQQIYLEDRQLLQNKSKLISEDHLLIQVVEVCLDNLQECNQMACSRPKQSKRQTKVKKVNKRKNQNKAKVYLVIMEHLQHCLVKLTRATPVQAQWQIHLLIKLQILLQILLARRKKTLNNLKKRRKRINLVYLEALQ